MSYLTISVKEAVGNINAQNNGWFLPAVQRPYVWGSRYESEKYICKLFDSIIKQYPIGTLIVWNTDTEIPYREFIQDYVDGQNSKQVEKGKWKRPDKWLVYDGQQRLQTLYSCLNYTLNNRVLVYNLLYKETADEEEIGFEFIDKDEEPKQGYIKMTELFCQPVDNKTRYRREVLLKIDNPTEEIKQILEERLDKLWSVFVGTDVKSLAYFPIDKSWDEDKVNDVFQRLNTGGVPLSGADLLFSRIKEHYPNFEEKINETSKWIFELTNGYKFSSNEILQLINLLVKGTTRIDVKKIKQTDVNEFKNIGDEISEPLKDFFNQFFYITFNINNATIVTKKLAILPLIVFAYKKYKEGIPFIKLDADNKKKMKQFFILSQLNDWNTQGMIDTYVRLILDNKEFPLDKIISETKEKRLIQLNANTLENNTWFTLKIAMPKRLFIEHDSTSGRYKPEIDHIYPTKLDGRDEKYFVDVVWNKQPVSGQTNLLKSNTHPLKFFTDEETKSHFDEYDFLNNDFKDLEWKDHNVFIKKRKERMIKFLKDEYALIIDN